MRTLLLTLVAIPLLAGCGSSQPYTQQDLHDVEQAWTVLRPLYTDFRTAFHRGDFQEMTRDYARERAECKHVDAIDQRDTIDPNTNLFQASGGLDGMCNTIESVYAAWEKAHHMRYDKTIVPEFLFEAFKGSNRGLRIMADFLRHPAEYSKALATPQK